MDPSIISSTLERILHPGHRELSRSIRPWDAALRAETEVARLLDWLGKVNFGLEGITVRISADGIEIGGGDWPLEPSTSKHHSISFERYCPSSLFASIIESDRASFEALLAWHFMGGAGYFDRKALAATRKIARVTSG